MAEAKVVLPARLVQRWNALMSRFLNFLPKSLRVPDSAGHVSARAGVILAAKLGGAALAFAVQIPFTRLLGAEEYGIYACVLSWVILAGVLNKGGMTGVLPRFIPVYRAEESWDTLKGLLLFTAAVAAAGTVGLALAAGGAFALAEALSPYASFFGSGLMLLIALSLNDLLAAALQGLKRPVLPEILRECVRPCAMLGFFLLLRVWRGADAHAALDANIAAVVLIVLILAVRFFRHCPAEARRARPAYDAWRDWTGLAGPMLLMAGMTVLLNRTDIIMLGGIAGPAAAGVYAIATRIAEITTFALLAATALMRPLVVEAWHAGDREKLHFYLRVSAWFVLGGTLPAIAALAGLGPFLLPVFGPDFSAAYAPLLILLAGRICAALTGPTVLLMIVAERQKKAALFQAGIVLLNVIGNVVLIPRMGMEGAALATAGSTALWNGILLAYVLTRLGLNPTVLPLTTGENGNGKQ